MSGARQPAIAVAGLRKSFDETVVLDGVDLTVAEGTVFALLGPNGAGKTTMMRILSTLITADVRPVAWPATTCVRRSGRGARPSIGVTGQFSALDELFTGMENMRLMADLHHLASAGPHGWTSYSSGSGSPMPRTSRCRPIPAACVDGSTWR